MPDGRLGAVSRRPGVLRNLHRVIPYAHYRDRPSQFELFFKRLTLLQRETWSVTAKENQRAADNQRYPHTNK
jgi:hypothetical protein